jgi:hypothetical protein
MGCTCVSRCHSAPGLTSFKCALSSALAECTRATVCAGVGVEFGVRSPSVTLDLLHTLEAAQVMMCDCLWESLLSIVFLPLCAPCPL